MEILFLLIPLAIIIAFVIAGFFFWSVKNGQFDDLQGPAHSILMDDDSPDLNHSDDLNSDQTANSETPDSTPNNTGN